MNMVQRIGFGSAAVAISLVLAACGGGRHAARGAEHAAHEAPVAGGVAEQSAPGSYSNDAVAAYGQPAPGAPPTAMYRGPAYDESARDTAPESESSYARPESRPGLGTEWGETRYNPVRSVSFSRSSSEPFAVTTVNYNDASGVRAMTGGYRGYEPCRIPVAGGAFTVSLEDPDGRPLSAVVDGGRFVALGDHGARYVIRIDNHTPHRVEAVASVDGLDVIDGDDGSFSKRGYLIGPWDSLAIEGFRRSSDEVASFRFGSVGESYAEKRGKGRNIGVIGVAFFREAGTDWAWNGSEIRRRQTADPFPNRFAPPPPRW